MRILAAVAVIFTLLYTGALINLSFFHKPMYS